MRKKTEIKKTMTLDEVLTINPNFQTILLGFGMHCLGCPCSRAETLEEASIVHGFDVQVLLDKLNAELNK